VTEGRTTNPVRYRMATEAENEQARRELREGSRLASEALRRQSGVSTKFILDLAFNDAADRARMWGEFADEYVRLGMLAYAMRGPHDAVHLSRQADKACLAAMDAEIATATFVAETLRK